MQVVDSELVVKEVKRTEWYTSRFVQPGLAGKDANLLCIVPNACSHATNL